MTKVIFDISMSLDGFVAASNVSPEEPLRDGGHDMYHTWTYTRIDPHERIEFVSNFANEEGTHLDPSAMGMPEGVPVDVPHVIVVKAAGDDKTEMLVKDYRYTAEEARDLSSV